VSENRPADPQKRPGVHSSTPAAEQAAGRPPRTDDGEPVDQDVQAKSPIPVNVLTGGQVLHGHVLGWRGERVYVRYRTSMGNHLAWADVERTDLPE
jgi:hypothetical protein